MLIREYFRVIYLEQMVFPTAIVMSPPTAMRATTIEAFLKCSYSAIEVLKVAVNVLKYFVRPVAAAASAVGGDLP